MLIPVMIALSLQISASHRPEFDIDGAYIGMSYSMLREKLPNLTCEAACFNQTATLYGFPGILWIGIGDSAVNQIAFAFKPTLTDREAETVRNKYVELYGKPSRLAVGGSCEEWDRRLGSIMLCLRNGLTITYWKDEKTGVTISVIPGET